MAFKDWTLKGRSLAAYIAVCTALTVGIGELAGRALEKQTREFYKQNRTALAQPAPRPAPQTNNPHEDEYLTNVMTGETTRNPAYLKQEQTQRDYSSRN